MDKKKTIQYQNYRFVAVIKAAQEGGFYAYCPTLPGCVSQGETYEETTANIKEAIEGYVETLIAHGDPIPEEAVEESYILDIPVKINITGNKPLFV